MHLNGIDRRPISAPRRRARPFVGALALPVNKLAAARRSDALGRPDTLTQTQCWPELLQRQSKRATKALQPTIDEPNPRHTKLPIGRTLASHTPRPSHSVSGPGELVVKLARSHSSAGPPFGQPIRKTFAQPIRPQLARWQATLLASQSVEPELANSTWWPPETDSLRLFLGTLFWPHFRARSPPIVCRSTSAQRQPADSQWPLSAANPKCKFGPIFRQKTVHFSRIQTHSTSTHFNAS